MTGMSCRRMPRRQPWSSGTPRNYGTRIEPQNPFEIVPGKIWIQNSKPQPPFWATTKECGIIPTSDNVDQVAHRLFTWKSLRKILSLQYGVGVLQNTFNGTTRHVDQGRLGSSDHCWRFSAKDIPSDMIPWELLSPKFTARGIRSCWMDRRSNTKRVVFPCSLTAQSFGICFEGERVWSVCTVVRVFGRMSDLKSRMSMSVNRGGISLVRS